MGGGNCNKDKFRCYRMVQASVSLMGGDAADVLVSGGVVSCKISGIGTAASRRRATKCGGNAAQQFFSAV
jgi:hypothetical protein